MLQNMTSPKARGILSPPQRLGHWISGRAFRVYISEAPAHVTVHFSGPPPSHTPSRAPISSGLQSPRTPANSLLRTLALPAAQFSMGHTGHSAPTLSLPWKCTSSHLLSPNYFSCNCSVCLWMPSALWGPLGLTLNCNGRRPTAISSWPFVAFLDRAGSRYFMTDYSFPSTNELPLHSSRFPLCYCCDTLPAFRLTWGFPAFPRNLGLLQFMPWLKMCCRVKHAIQGRVFC